MNRTQSKQHFRVVYSANHVRIFMYAGFLVGIGVLLATPACGVVDSKSVRMGYVQDRSTPWLAERVVSGEGRALAGY